MVTYYFNESLQILEVIYEGNISFEDIINHGKYLSENNSFPKKLKILTDARNANYNISPTSIPEIQKALKQNLTKFELVMEAFLHSKPKETAYSILLDEEEEQKHNNYSRKVFNAREAALDWLR